MGFSVSRKNLFSPLRWLRKRLPVRIASSYPYLWSLQIHTVVIGSFVGIVVCGLFQCAVLASGSDTLKDILVSLAVLIQLGFVGVWFFGMWSVPRPDSAMEYRAGFPFRYIAGLL